jgi:hypothetical protein
MSLFMEEKAGKERKERMARIEGLVKKVYREVSTEKFDC